MANPKGTMYWILLTLTLSAWVLNLWGALTPGGTNWLSWAAFAVNLGLFANMRINAKHWERRWEIRNNKLVRELDDEYFVSIGSGGGYSTGRLGYGICDCGDCY